MIGGGAVVDQRVQRGSPIGTSATIGHGRASDTSSARRDKRRRPVDLGSPATCGSPHPSPCPGLQSPGEPPWYDAGFKSTPGGLNGRVSWICSIRGRANTIVHRVLARSSPRSPRTHLNWNRPRVPETVQPSSPTQVVGPPNPQVGERLFERIRRGAATASPALRHGRRGIGSVDHHAQRQIIGESPQIMSQRAGQIAHRYVSWSPQTRRQSLPSLRRPVDSRSAFAILRSATSNARSSSDSNGVHAVVVVDSRGAPGPRKATRCLRENRQTHVPSMIFDHHFSATQSVTAAVA